MFVIVLDKIRLDKTRKYKIRSDVVNYNKIEKRKEQRSDES